MFRNRSIVAKVVKDSDLEPAGDTQSDDVDWQVQTIVAANHVVNTICINTAILIGLYMSADVIRQCAIIGAKARAGVK